MSQVVLDCTKDNSRCPRCPELSLGLLWHMMAIPDNPHTNITVANITRLTMLGESSSGNTVKIVCSESVGLSFTSIENLKIYSVAFTSCSRKGDNLPANNFSLLLQSTLRAELVNCLFHNNFGTALVVINTNITLTGKSDFRRNHCAITAHSSNLAFTGNIIFFENIAKSLELNSGAIYASSNSILNFNGTSNFISNSAYNGSGAIFVCNSALNFNGNNSFISNRGYKCGGAITTLNSALSFNGNNSFISNSAYKGGGAIYSRHGVLSFNGTNSFINNSAAYGSGALSIFGNTVLHSNNFNRNSADNDGAISASENSKLSFSGTNNFLNNSDHTGGVGGAIIMVGFIVYNINGTTNFFNNSAYSGGAIYALKTAVLNFNGATTFVNNSADNGGAISVSNNFVLNFSGTNKFLDNLADLISGLGGAIFATGNGVCSINGTSNFINNSAVSGGAIFTSSNAVLSLIGFSSFINNSADNGGAICVDINGTLTFNGDINFTNNRHSEGKMSTLRIGTCGGGVYVGLKSTLVFLPNTTVFWEKNHATLGGAIYVDDISTLSYCYRSSIASYIPKKQCLFQLHDQNLSSIQVQLLFKNNSADAAGSLLYGGAIDNCKLTGLQSYNSSEVFDILLHNNDIEYNTTSTISSDPFHICLCKNNLPDCSETEYGPIAAYPGETFHIPVVAVGQRNGTVPSIVQSVIKLGNNLEVSLQDNQYLQTASNTCTKLNYTVFSLSTPVMIDLHAEGNPCSKVDPTYMTHYTLLIYVNLTQNCPPGFNISEAARACVCEPRLAQYAGIDKCNITNGLGQITRNSGQKFWVGYDNQSHELILHPHCPFGYCVYQKVVFSLRNTDIQCVYDRSDLLCGACKKGYSLMFGTFICKQCTNIHLFLLIPFALMGVALVFLLLACKLTVATGTLSGLVFYANIVGVNHNIFLPVKTNNPYSVFIAWLNLDFGIDTCFYNGMDTYTKTWLQFVFPVYIWVIVGLMVIASQFSRRFANLLGNNPVPVLATLILFSYTKILRTLITVLYVTYLEYPMYKRWVWLYDANVDYLSGKHIPLFLVAVLIFFFLFLPYTLLLLFGQWLQAISHLRLFSWVNSARLKPFLDSYHAPYRAKHRYWPGLLLLLRFVLLLVFAFNFQEDPRITLLAILVGTGLFQMCAWISGGVYRKWCLNVLEGSFALNLIILVGATYYIRLAKGNPFHQLMDDQLAVGHTSVFIAFVTFIGILGFQLVKVTGIAQWLKRRCAAVANSPTDSLPDRLINPGNYEPLLHTQQETISEPTENLVNEEQRSLNHVYTYTYGTNH